MKIYSTPNLMGNGIKNPAVYSSEDINELFDLSEEEAVELTKVISNQVAINKVYSSQKTEERLAEILIEANEFATEQLGKSNFLSIDIVTSESEVVDEHVLYLIDDGTSTNTYNQYVLIGGVAKSLGSTQCDLSNYVTNEQLNEKLEDYAKKNEVIGTNSIVTIIDDSITNDQVIGAVALKDYVTNVKETLEANFQDGVNTIYDAVVLKGQTPLDKSPDSIKNAIANISTGEGTVGIFDTLPYTKMRVTSTANSSLGCSTTPTGYTSKGLCIMSNGVNTGSSMTFAIGENEIEQLGSYCVGTGNGNSNITDIDVQELSKVETLYYFMHDSSKLKSLVFSGKVDTSKCTNMYASFYNNTLLESLDLSKFDTSNVTNMYTMFKLCKSLSTLDVSSFNTTNVKQMNEMFDGCNKLTSLDLSHFDVSNCTTLSAMLRNCTSLNYLNTSSWQFDSITTNPLTFCRNDGSQILYGSTALETLIANDMGSKSTKITSMSRLLEGCSASHIELNNLNIPNVTSLSFAFYSCPNLTTLSMKNLNAPKLTNIDSLFNTCPNLNELDLTGLDTSNITNMNSLFSGCKSIEQLDLSMWDVSKVTTTGNIFANMSSLKYLNISNWVLDSIAIGDTEYYMLGNQMSGCTALENLIVNNLNIYKATDFTRRFQNCPAKNIQANNWNLESVTNMTYLFHNANAESISIENLEMPNCTNISHAFVGCKSLKQLDLSSWDVSNVRNFARIFQNCTALTDLNLDGWNFNAFDTNHHASDNCFGVFMSGCNALETLHANNWKVDTKTSFEYMLNTCPAQNIEANDWDLPSIINLKNVIRATKATSISAKNLNAPLATTLENAFRYNLVLETIDVTGWYVPLVTSFLSTFHDCQLLETVDFTGWSDTSKVTTTQNMFYGCKALKTLDLKPLNLDNVTNSSDMFNGCTALEELDLSNWNTAKLATRSNMFKSVPSTCVIKVGANWTLTEAQTGFTGTFVSV